MPYRTILVSPRGRDVVSTSLSDTNDMLCRGYTIKPDPPQPDSAQSDPAVRKPRKPENIPDTKDTPRGLV